MEAGHSDPEKLKEAALDIERLSSQDLKQRQVEIKVRFVARPHKNPGPVYSLLQNYYKLVLFHKLFCSNFL